MGHDIFAMPPGFDVENIKKQLLESCSGPMDLIHKLIAYLVSHCILHLSRSSMDPMGPVIYWALGVEDEFLGAGSGLQMGAVFNAQQIEDALEAIGKKNFKGISLQDDVMEVFRHTAQVAGVDVPEPLDSDDPTPEVEFLEACEKWMAANNKDQIYIFFC